MKVRAITELRRRYPVTALLRLAELPRSTYYYHCKNTDKLDKYQKIKAEIQEIYAENKGRYGYRRIHAELHNRGYSINHKTVQRLMKELGLFCKVRMKKYNSYRGSIGKAAPNLLNRNFHAEKPLSKLVTDVTEFQMDGQKLYLSPIIDLYNGEVISYNLSCHPDMEQVRDMLKKAFTRIPDNSHAVLHSDQGWQYRMEEYQEKLKGKGIIQSMSRKATCLDNAVAENFFSLLKTELIYLESFENIEALSAGIEEYIEYYNQKRIKLRLNGMSPVAYRQAQEKRSVVCNTAILPCQG